jgi:hypothetical protein
MEKTFKECTKLFNISSVVRNQGTWALPKLLYKIESVELEGKFGLYISW